MANVGDVNVRVTADTQQFRAGMAGAAVSMKQLKADVRAATLDFRAGRISQKDYATAIQHTRQQSALLRQETLALRPAGLAAAKGLGTVRSSLASLAAMSLGVKGTLGTFGSALMFMSLGNLTAIGVIAGIMAIAKLWQVVTSRAREAKKAQKEAIETAAAAFRKTTEYRRGEIDQLLTTARAEQEGLQVKAAQWIGAKNRTVFAKDPTERLRTVNRAIKDLVEEARAMDAAAESASISAMKPAVAYAEATKNLDALRQAAERAVATFNRFNPDPSAFLPQNRYKADGRMKKGDDPLSLLTREKARQIQQLREEMAEIGHNIGRVFAQNFWDMFVHRSQSLGGMLKNLFLTLVGTALSNAIAKGLASLATSFAGGGIGKVLGFLFAHEATPALAGGGAVPINRGVSMNVSVGAASDPFSLARDAQWQMALRESIRFANSQGFRG